MPVTTINVTDGQLAKLNDVYIPEIVVCGSSEEWIEGYIQGMIRILSLQYPHVYYFTRTEGKITKTLLEDGTYFSIIIGFGYIDANGESKAVNLTLRDDHVS